MHRPRLRLGFPRSEYRRGDRRQALLHRCAAIGGRVRGKCDRG